MNQDVVEFFTKDANDIFCFGNDAGQGKIEIYWLTRMDSGLLIGFPAVRFICGTGGWGDHLMGIQMEPSINMFTVSIA